MDKTKPFGGKPGKATTRRDNLTMRAARLRGFVGLWLLLFMLIAFGAVALAVLVSLAEGLIVMFWSWPLPVRICLIAAAVVSGIAAGAIAAEE